MRHRLAAQRAKQLEDYQRQQAEIARQEEYIRRNIAGQNTRQAEKYRAGRVLLVGDAAHVHSAMGGPGLNLGMQDVFNLGWKLAAVVDGRMPADLLDTYESERFPVGERVMMHSRAQMALMSPGPEVGSLRTLFGELLGESDVREHMAGLLAGADVRYDMGGADHPLTGSPAMPPGDT